MLKTFVFSSIWINKNLQLQFQESTHLNIAQKLNESETRLAKMLSQKFDLESENEKLRHTVFVILF